MYLSMVRNSLMIPYAPSEFDPTIDGFRLTIKWDNNVQNIKGSYVIPIFKDSFALDAYLHIRSCSSGRDPLFINRANLANGTCLLSTVKPEKVRYKVIGGEMKGMESSMNLVALGATQRKG